MEKRYYKHKIENLLHVNKIVTVHYFEFDKEFVAPTESHDFWELVYADKGQLICQADEKEILLQEGELLFHKPNEPHSLRADKRTAPNVVILSFECKSPAVRFFENKRLRLDRRHIPYLYSIIDESKRTFDLPYSDPALKKMPLLANPTLGGSQLIKNLLEILLINIMRDETEQKNQNATFLRQEEFDNRITGQALAFLRAHVRERISVEELCKQIHYNKSHLFAQFKESTGYSVMAYFTKLKIEESKRLLRQTDKTVAQIAEELSFDTPNYFSKTFKKWTRYTPSTYRKIHTS